MKSMISYIKGVLTYKGENDIVLENGGIGYRISVSAACAERLPKTGEEVKIYTYMNVKEDGISLFGFRTAEERSMFLKLLSVGGVGPKGALGVLTALTPQDITIAIISADAKTLSNAPGIGRKTAQRIILELKDKCSAEEAVIMPADEAETDNASDGAKYEAIEAMTALGYSRSEAVRAVSGVAENGMNTEEILKAALKKMVTF